MAQNVDLEKSSNGNPARSPPQPKLNRPISPEDISAKPHPAAREALDFLRSVEYNSVSEIAKNVVIGHTSWAVRTIRTLLCELLNLPREHIPDNIKISAYHFAIALQRGRRELALLHMKRGMLHLDMGHASLAISDALRAISLDKENSNGYFLLSSFLLEAYKPSQNMPPEMFRMAHKMAHLGWKLNPSELHLELAFDVSVPPVDSKPRVVDDESRKQVIKFSMSDGDSGALLFPPLNSRSTWWSNAFRRLIMFTLPPCQLVPRLKYRNFRNEPDKMNFFLDQLGKDFDQLHYIVTKEMNSANQVEDLYISLCCSKNFSPGDIIFEEPPYISASSLDSLGGSCINSNISSNLSTSGQTSSAKESARRKRYGDLRKWARYNNCPEVLLVWQYLVRLKESRKMQSFGSDCPIYDPFPYLIHPSDFRFKKMIRYRFRFWHHYSAYIRLSWAWGFAKEHQEYDFEWYLDKVGTIVLNAHKLNPPIRWPTKGSNNSELCEDDNFGHLDGIPGDMMINIRVEGSPFIPVIPGHASNVPSVMALFKTACFIQNDCINPTVEYNMLWKENGPRLQVVALKILTPGTVLTRSIFPELKGDRKMLAKFGSFCSCVECARLPRPIDVEF